MRRHKHFRLIIVCIICIETNSQHDILFGIKAPLKIIVRYLFHALSAYLKIFRFYRIFLKYYLPQLVKTLYRKSYPQHIKPCKSKP